MLHRWYIGRNFIHLFKIKSQNKTENQLPYYKKKKKNNYYDMKDS